MEIGNIRYLNMVANQPIRALIQNMWQADLCWRQLPGPCLEFDISCLILSVISVVVLEKNYTFKYFLK